MRVRVCVRLCARCCMYVYVGVDVYVGGLTFFFLFFLVGDFGFRLRHSETFAIVCI